MAMAIAMDWYGVGTGDIINEAVVNVDVVNGKCAPAAVGIKVKRYLRPPVQTLDEDPQ